MATVEELLDSQRVQMPPNAGTVPFRRKAPKVRGEKAEQQGLFGHGAG